VPRRRTGEVIERDRQGGRVFALRFRAYGQRRFVTLGGAADGWTRAKAEAELRHVLADVERGLWVPDVERTTHAPASPSFHEFASEWLEARRGELRESTIADYTWQLSNHLLPFFHRHRLAQITVAEVDRYRTYKVREQVLSAESINKTITRLGQSLAVAEERDLIPRNPVRVNTRNRKLKAKRRRPVYFDSAAQIVAMIDAATELDAKPQARAAGRRALVATLVYAGLRIGEATALRCGRTSTSPTAGSPSVTPRPRPGSGWSTSWPRCATSCSATGMPTPKRSRTISSSPPRAAAAATRTTRASA
jgi:integrase